MKTFKDIETFKEKLKTSLCWEDYFKINDLTFKLFEYGSLSDSEDYVYFYNKFSKQMIYIKYICPSYNYIKGVKTQTKEYKFISLEVEENPYLWREDTL